MRSRTLRVAFCLLAALDLGSAIANADATKAQCVKSNADAQSLRREGKLAAARAQLEMCGDPKCPGIVRTDCAKRLDELESAQPTIVLEVKDGSGHDVAAVTVLVDGQPLVARLDGTALPIDPGSHEFTFAVAGQRSVVQTYLISEGQRGRHETILLGSLPPRTTPDEPPSSLPQAGVEEATGREGGGMATQRVLALAAGGVGVAGVVVGSIFGLIASSTWSQAQSDCGAACRANAPARSEESDARTAATVSTVGFVAGGIGLAAGAVLWFTAPPATSRAASSARVRLAPSLGPAAGGVLVRGEF